MGGTLNQGLCNGYFNNPLPSTRDLWDIISNAEWTKRYQQWLNRDNGDSLLKIEDLKLWQQHRETDTAGNREQQAIHKLAQWCENLDNFGTLIWIATKFK